MEDDFTADYDDLEQFADRFATQAASLQKLLEKMNLSLQKLEDSGWVGDAADKFFLEMSEEILPAAGRLLVALETAGYTTINIVQIVQRAEEEATTPFRSS